MKDKKQPIDIYQPQVIEKKWQEQWDKDGIYEFKKTGREKYYNLVELPYPSGDLHMGHWFTFVYADAHARYKRMAGFDVFFPNGFDAFGLPAENAAIKRNIHPQNWTMKNIETMTKQFNNMGTMIDWTHEAITCLPEYYRWNQYIFIKMFEKGIAYRGKMLSNWCPVDKTVLANEHIEAGKCWRCGATVEQKEVEQWFLKITEYADRLEWNKDGNGVDWPVSVMDGQNNWIGKKLGMKIKHKVVASKLEFETFTAYPAWSWADTFIVIAPEHPLVEKLVKGTPHENAVMQFVSEMGKESELDRKETTEKKGVFTGKYAKDPFGGPDLPIWLANFALMNFGTGIIRCSAHDPRDFSFAQKYDIAVKQVVQGVDDVPANAHNLKGILQDSGPFTGREVGEITAEVMDWIEKQGIGKKFVNYHLHDWSVSRQRYWGTPVPMIHCQKCGIVPVSEKDLPVTLPYNVDYTPKGKPPLATDETWLNVVCPKCGGKAKRDAETLDTFFDSAWYYYRYVSPHDDKAPFDKQKVADLLPVDVYFGGAEHTLGHTLYARFFTKFFKDLGWVSFDEFAKKRAQHGTILGPDGNRMSKSKGNVVNPDEVAKEYGVDSVRLFLCFMMPFEATAPWSTGAIWGIYRFLKRVWEMGNNIQAIQLSPEDLTQMHKTIKKVGHDLANLQLNTAVASLMTWINYLATKSAVSEEEYETFLKLLAPFAPHITEELWHQLHSDAASSIHLQQWPEYQETFLISQEQMIVVQVNGKLRENIIIKQSQALIQQEVEALAKKSSKVQKYLSSGTLKKVIYVPGKIINFVVQ